MVSSFIHGSSGQTYKNSNVELIFPKELTQKIIESDKKIILMMGAGDIGELVTVVQQNLNKIML